MLAIRKAVILAAGLGTRMLPATKAVAKELLPVVDKPLIQYAVEEAVNAGVTEVVFVIAPGKEAIREHFGSMGRIAQHAQAMGDERLLEMCEAPSRLATFHYVYQEQALGIAHAVACARLLVEGEPFALLFPDDLIVAFEPCLRQLIRAWQPIGGSVIAVQDVPRAETSQYGIVDVVGTGNPASVRGLVEKPSPATAPSTLGIVGRYILSETTFAHIDRQAPGAKGEMQITDTLASQAAAGERVSAFRFEGRRFDTGRPVGYLSASMAVALEREDLREPLLAQMRDVVEAGVR